MAKTTLTRRQWAGALAAAQAAVAAPQTTAAPEEAADLLARAKQAVARNRETLAKFKIDRALEPAARFEA